ncbi:hypothetical protein PAL_GLEAN10000457 [Pteropus alecto]|uniref:Uncharacterized protein n=1 Tax=Pteropus alecto TaxID=9402 RepID=L5K614_PTEAL|nr:hypothetical protein PAL_GLEAN10000457 [Pteropus alecto]
MVFRQALWLKVIELAHGAQWRFPRGWLHQCVLQSSVMFSGESPEFPSDSLNTLPFHWMTDMAENTVGKQKSRGRTPNTVPNPHMQPCSRFVSTVPEQFPITALEMPGSWDGLGLCRNNQSRVQDQSSGLSKESLRSLLWYRKQLTSSIEYIPDRMPSGSPGPRTLGKSLLSPT